MTQKLHLVLGGIENIVGKGENAGYQHFPLFSQCFQKLSFPEVPRLGGSVVSVSDSWPGGCELRRLLSGVFSPLFSAEACEKSSRWLWKKKLC